MIRRVGGIFFIAITLTGCGRRDDKAWCTVDLLEEIDCRYESKGQCQQWIFDGSPYIVCQPNPKNLNSEEEESDPVSS